MEVAKYYSASFCCRPKPLTCYKILKSEIYVLDIQPFMVIGLAIARLDRRARIQLGRVHFGVFSTSCFPLQWGAQTDLLEEVKIFGTHGGPN